MFPLEEWIPAGARPAWPGVGLKARDASCSAPLHPPTLPPYPPAYTEDEKEEAPLEGGIGHLEALPRLMPKDKAASIARKA